jgi:hypothetical protein
MDPKCRLSTCRSKHQCTRPVLNNRENLNIIPELCYNCIRDVYYYMRYQNNKHQCPCVNENCQIIPIELTFTHSSTFYANMRRHLDEMIIEKKTLDKYRILLLGSVKKYPDILQIIYSFLATPNLIKPYRV